jgi:hypothetical protein
MVKNADPTLTGAQLRAARALIGLRAEDLAQETKVSLRTIRRAEQEDGPVKMTAANLSVLVSALEGLGICFVAFADGSVGVSIRKKRSSPAVGRKGRSQNS